MTPGRPTLGDVAREAGVHKATASRALNGATRNRVNSDTAARVRAAALTLGYRPNRNARELRLRSSSTIGLLIPNVLSPIYPPLVRGVQQALRPHDRFALIADAENDPDQELRALENLLDRGVDGLIAATHHSARPVIADLAARGVAVVFLEDASAMPGTASVRFDMAMGVDALVGLLVGLGHRRLAHIAGADTGGDARERAQMHHEAFRCHGIDPAGCVEIEAPGYDVPAGHAAATTLLRDHPEVTAVLAYNDPVAIGTLQALHEAGLRCPEDVSVVGYNDIPLVDALRPPLTTVRLDTARQGAEAAEVLVARLADPGRVEHRTLPVTLEVRGSHGPVRERH